MQEVSQMNFPIVSIIIPCYNQGEFLNEAILSVYNQSYSNWECIIVNDGSTDDSENIVKEWLNKDKRVKYFYKVKGGVSSARNMGIREAKGNYIQFLDSDDLLDSRKLELSLFCLTESKIKDQKIIISNFRMFTNNANKTTEPYCILVDHLFTFENILYKWNESFSIPIHCGFFETSLFENIHFPENLSAQEDWIVWVKLFKLNIKAIFLDEPLAFYRQNLNSRTMTKSFYQDQIIAYETFKSILSEEEFYKLSKILIFRYYREQEDFKNRLKNVKKSYSYQTGLMIKKVLKAVGLLNVFKLIFPFFLKLKSK